MCISFFIILSPVNIYIIYVVVSYKNVIVFVLAFRYLSSLILIEGMDIDFLHKCALEDCTVQHQFSSAPDVIKVCFG